MNAGPLIIAIDGPAASGKGTLARRLAAHYGLRHLDTGLTYINSSTIGAEVQLPFGGTKGTGNGHREAGTTALEIFTEWKSVFVDYSGALQKAQIED